MSILDSFLGRLKRRELDGFGVYTIGILDGAEHSFVEAYPGVEYRMHSHPGTRGTLHMIEGEGYVTIGSERTRYRPGDSFYVGSGVPHGFEVEKPTLMLTINKPPITDPETGVANIEY